MRSCLSILTFLSISVFSAFSPTPIYAVTNPVTDDSTVTATVPSTATQGDTTTPTVPILLRPFDGTVTADDGKSEFAWRQSTDPNGNTVIYTFYLDGVATYLGISNLGNSIGAGYSSRIESGDVRLLPSGILPEGSHDWYVTAEDLSGNKSYSATWHFTIDITPPSLAVIDIENYHLPAITNGSTFDIQAPQDVDFVINTESYASIYLTIVNSEGQSLATISQTSDNTGLVYPFYYLDEGIYSVIITATDRAGLTSSLPDFFLNLYIVSIPLPSLPPIIRPPRQLPPRIVIPPPPSVPTLPATVAKLATRGILAYTPYILLASLGIILLIIIWRRKFNLHLIDASGNPVTYVEIYHSHHKYKGKTHYQLNNDLGRIYIPHLKRFSTLTIKHEGVTLILSVSRKSRHYTITI